MSDKTECDAVLCEVNGVPVLCRDEDGGLYAPEGLEGIAAYFEASGTPEDVYGGDLLAELAPVEVHIYPDVHYDTAQQEKNYRVFVHGKGAWEQGEYLSDSFKRALYEAKNNIVNVDPHRHQGGRR